MTRERLLALLRDAAIGLMLAGLVLALIWFASAGEPTFIYQAF